MSELRITGSGGLVGGGRKNKTPVEEPDTLRANAIASVLYLLSEGQIGGLVNGGQSIFLDNTPLIDTTGKANFQGATWEVRGGTQAQTAIQGIRGIEAEQQVGVKLTFNTAIIRTLEDENADTIKVRLLVASLQSISDKGDIRQTSVRFRIEVTNNNVYETRIDDTLTGKTTSPYQWDYSITLRGESPWSIRVTRLTADSTSNKLQNELTWSSFSSVISNRLRYPNSALLALKFPAEQFRSIPQVAVLLDGVFVRVPHNYNTTTRAYTGVFNGSLVMGQTNNPAWILYDLLTNTRYGCGKYIDASQIDVWSFYQIAQYCDGSVPNGKGHFEPRFTCNAYLQNREDAYKVLNTLASVFRGMLYWSAGTIFATQDSPANPVRLFTDANVVQEVDDQGRVTKPPFIYAGSALSSRHTVALVSWSDPDDNYQTKIESVEDVDGINRYGYNETEVVAFGCTSQGQARRTGEWLLYSERVETETLTFRVGSEGMLVRPGEIIKVADPARAGLRWGGRITAATLGTITLDTPVFLGLGFTYRLSLLASDGKQAEYNVTTGTGTHTTLALSGMTEVPPAGSVWVLQNELLMPQLFRVISVVEQEQETYEITALAHNPSKYAAIELDRPLQFQNISILPDPTIAPAAPAGLTVNEALYTTRSNQVRIKAILTFAPTTSPYANEYQGQYRITGTGQWTIIGNTLDTFLEIEDIAQGVYDFRVRAINALGVGSEWSTITQEIFGIAGPPATIQGLTATALGESLLLAWKQANNLDVVNGGQIQVKHTSRIGGVTWNDGTLMATLPGAATSIVLSLVRGTYQVMAVDATGLLAIAPAQIVPSIGSAQFLRIGGRIQISPEFTDPVVTGPKINTTISDGGLRLIDSWNIDLWDDWDSIPNIDTYRPDTTPDIPANGSYFAYRLALGPASNLSASFNYRVRLSADFAVQILDLLNSIDTVLNFDEIENIDDGIETPQGVTATLQIAVLKAGTVYNPNPVGWQSQYTWQDFRAGEYEGQNILFRVLMTGNAAGTATPLVDRLAIDWDLIPRIESGTVTFAGTETVPFAQSFGGLPDVAVSILNAQSGEFVQIERFTDKFLATLNPATVRRTISWIARGFGAYSDSGDPIGSIVAATTKAIGRVRATLSVPVFRGRVRAFAGASAALTGVATGPDWAISQSTILTHQGIPYQGTRANLSDNDFATGAWTQTNTNQWVKLTFTEPETVIGLITGGGSSILPVSQLNGRTIQYSTDDTNWTSLRNINNAVANNLKNDYWYPAVSARYWRVFSSSSVVATAELRPVVNDATPIIPTVTQSSIWQGNSTYAITFAKLTDSSLTTGGITESSSPQWVQFDFGATVNTIAMVIAGGNLSGFGTIWSVLRTAALQYSNDGNNWTTHLSELSNVIPELTNTNILDAYTLTLNVSARYWRLSRASGNGWIPVALCYFIVEPI